MSAAPDLSLWSVMQDVGSITTGFTKADTEKKEVLTFYKFGQTVKSVDIEMEIIWMRVS